MRALETKKRDSARSLSEHATFSIGLDGTPIWNLGIEIWSILDVLSPYILGPIEEFKREWCDYSGAVVEPTLLNSFLKNLGIMVRRTYQDIGRKPEESYKTVYTLEEQDSDEETSEVLKKLSLSILSANYGTDDYSDSVSQFDFKLREATGIAKAKQVAEFVKQLVAEEGKVMLCGWHHAVYKIWKEELKELKPVFINGDATLLEKEELKKAFIEGDSQILVMSLRSGAGLNGLQFVCNTLVFGELDWTNAAMEQIVFRLTRRGQPKPVNIYYMALNTMADPFILERLNIKRAQATGVVEGIDSDVEFMGKQESTSLEKLREMARAYLLSIGEEAPEVVDESGTIGEVARVLRGIRVTTSDEAGLQEKMLPILNKELPFGYLVDREVKISKKSRLDFLVTKGDDKIVIECKITTTKRAEVVRQVRRYIEEMKPTGVILYVPWATGYNFNVDGVPVLIISYSLSSI